MPINKGVLRFALCGEFCNFAPNFEVYVHLMFTKNIL